MPQRKELADALRVLAIDAIEQAQSGHPGAPMGMADMAEALWRHHFVHNPNNPHWVNRDRFVLSNGHASMLLYGLLALTGYDVSFEDLKNFRQLGSKTPGHPEYGVTSGVDMTTGPLGQGLASAVGMALAERLLASEFNTPDYTIVDHNTFCFCGDGCLMEGVSAEACSLAGTWNLGRLIVLYDANGISIDGEISAWFDEDVAARFNAYHWQVIGPIDGHDFTALDQAISAALAETTKPSLIICKTHIGYGSSKEDSASSHGAPLGATVAAQARQRYGWKDAPFVVNEEIRNAWDGRAKGAASEEAWKQLFNEYAQKYPEKAQEFERRMKAALPDSYGRVYEEYVATLLKAKEALATRKASQHFLEAVSSTLPELVGGSADLTGSVGTKTSSSRDYDAKTGSGNYLAYGVREFGMGCIMNGLALHGGFVPYAGTFLSFSDQAKNALRLAALMQLHQVWVFTHDSIGVGEDGPTHQPIEQIAALRDIPGLRVWRPCDCLETACAWNNALREKLPQALVLSRQKLPALERKAEDVALIERGGYVFASCNSAPELILLATGSEVSLALLAYEQLSKEGYAVRVVAMPCTELFDAQDAAWKEAVLPSSCRRRIAIEAASTDFWWKYVGLDGKVIGMHGFGLSGKAEDLTKHFGFTVERVVEEARQLLDTK